MPQYTIAATPCDTIPTIVLK